MTTRDRLVLMGIVVLAVLAAGWLVVVSPERSKASKIDAEVSTARAELESARQQVVTAKGAQAKYSQAYASIVRLGKAVPPDSQIPSLVYQLDQASNQKDVNFESIMSTTGSTGASTPAASTSLTPTAFTAMPFTFVFKGNFFSLYHLFNQVNRFTLPTASGGVQVTGRLLTIQSANLDLQDQGQTESGNSSSSSSTTPGELTGTITATAYVLPASQGLTGGATASGPAGQSETTSASSSAPTTPAVARVTP